MKRTVGQSPSSIFHLKWYFSLTTNHVLLHSGTGFRLHNRPPFVLGKAYRMRPEQEASLTKVSHSYG